MTEENGNQLARLQVRSDKLSAIEKKQHEVRALKEEWQRKKDGALRAKKAYDEENEELHMLIEEAQDRQLPLPGLSAQDLARMNGQTFVLDAVAPAIATEPKQPEAWRSIPVAEALDVSLKVLDILEEAEIGTMGEFVDADAAGKVRELKGVGDKTYDKLKDQMVNWVSVRQITDETEAPGPAPGLPSRVFILESETDVEVLKWIGGRPVVQIRAGAPEVVLSSEDWRELSDEEQGDDDAFSEIQDDEEAVDEEEGDEFEDEAVMVADEDDEEDEDDEDPI